MKHEHSFNRSKPTATVETCVCGKFKFTEHSGKSIEEKTIKIGGKTMNSLRDEVKDAVRRALMRHPAIESEGTANDADLIATLADSVFDVLGVSEDQQDKPFKRFVNADDEVRFQVEAWVDKLSLSHFLALVADVCMEKVKHLEENWQDEETAKWWERARKLIVAVVNSVCV